jgi:hypothetical protein
MRSPRFRIWAANLRARSSTCQEGIRSTDFPGATFSIELPLAENGTGGA